MIMKSEQVRSDIPVPKIRRGRPPVHRFWELKPPKGKEVFSMHVNSSIKSVRSCLALFKKNHQPTWEFAVAEEDDGVRVWRTK